MTNERAVEILNLDLDILGQYGDETAEAYKMAIQALEAQPSDSNITDPCDGCRYELNSTNGNPCYSCGKYKLTEQQPSEDDFVKHKKEVLERIAKREREIDKYIKELEALEQQPSEDCISREEVQDLISRWLSDYLLDETREALETINYKVGDMPPVKPKRPKGKWIEYKVDIAPHPLHCSLCGFSNHHISNRYMRDFRRCPNCGAEMSGGGEDV